MFVNHYKLREMKLLLRALLLVVLLAIGAVAFLITSIVTKHFECVGNTEENDELVSETLYFQIVTYHHIRSLDRAGYVFFELPDRVWVYYDNVDLLDLQVNIKDDDGTPRGVFSVLSQKLSLRIYQERWFEGVCSRIER